VRDEEYRPIVLQGFLVDITERVEREGALHQSEELNRFVAEASRELIVVFELDGTIDYVSPSITSLLGYEASELRGRRWGDVVHPRDAEVTQAHFNQRAAGLEPPTSVTRVLHKDGSWVAFEGSLSAIEDRHGVASHFVALCRPAPVAALQPAAA
jgi:PAS domain S-box-containing protein